MPRLTFLFPFSILLSSVIIPTAFTANIQAGSQASLYQPSQAPSAASVDAVSTASASQITPSSIPANGDPCGPAHQDNPNYPNTCNLVPSLVESPSAYGINCTPSWDVNKKYPRIAVIWTNVEHSIESICTKMEDSRTLTGIWVWSGLAPSAALGFFLPPYKGAAARPSMQRCLQIYAAMNNTCATTVIASSYASINLGTLPGYGAAGSPQNPNARDGSAVDVGYISYALTNRIQ